MIQIHANGPDPTFPIPDDTALESSHRLTEYIKRLISDARDSIGFDQYMSLCLYKPGLGYYSSGTGKFGRDGDFITAPGVSALFSKCIANQCMQILDRITDGIILELGAGNGQMASDILLELERNKSLPEQYLILEISADLKQRQQARLNHSVPHLVNRIKWLDKLPDKKFNGIILGNEVIDAMPVRRFRKTAHSFNEVKVNFARNQFIWEDTPADDGFIELLNKLDNRLKKPMQENHVAEINTDLQQWLDSFTELLETGVMLFIDYGYPESDYYHPERHHGCLLCHYRHHAHSDPFLYPGLQDITASVNFTALAEAAVNSGLTVSGYTTQTCFLTGCGLENFITDINSLDIRERTEMAYQIKMLIMPEEMGERFKCIALGKGYNYPLSGFSIMDQRARL